MPKLEEFVVARGLDVECIVPVPRIAVLLLGRYPQPQGRHPPVLTAAGQHVGAGIVQHDGRLVVVVGGNDLGRGQCGQ